jgi:hypothetical protein
MNTTVRNKLALLSAGQAQKEVTHNEALVAIDRLLHPSVKSRSLSAPPADPALGESWIVGEAATGAWSGQEQAIAVFEGYGWGFVLPRLGLAAFIEDEDGMAIWRGQWSAGWPVSQLSIASPAVISLPAGGVTVDAELRESFGSLVTALQGLGLTA